LSQNRAKSVYDYLIKKGIDKTRLTYKGYGDTKPIADNKTEEGKQQNRRTEITIVN
jgi:outer membrane protein OmpA-like peptidoglycan-associated protein